ncbi:MAG: carboxypeptidase-like regulatory domain-containing protein, partial [Prevotella sp.]|nr:carboxypeptidase-like regulatory domain-containing protein [Prevotella sp.]
MNPIKKNLTCIVATAIAMLPLQALAVGETAGTYNQIAQAEQKTKVSGTVVDDKTGEPLIGVSVTIANKGKMLTGGVTDIEGKFSLTAPNGDFEVHISYIGYTNQVLVSGRDKLSGITIRLQEEENTLSDVVVTGFFNKNKQTFTGSVTQIKGADLKKVSGVNLIGAIAALTPGMAMVENTRQGSNPNQV